jgi:hypothetical protein
MILILNKKQSNMKTMTKATTAACLALLTMVSITLSSCKKDGSNNSNSSSALSLLTSARWTFQKYEYEKPDGTWIPDPDAVDANKFTIGFSTNYATSEIDIGNGYTTAGTWSFSSNNTVITTTVGYDLQPAAYTVNTLTESTLVLTQLNYPSGSTYIGERLTFTH